MDTMIKIHMQNRQAQALAAFKQGREDCRKGVPHKIKLGKHYNNGYGFEYTVDARREARAKHSE